MSGGPEQEYFIDGMGEVIVLVIELTVVVGLIVLNGFVAMSELALVSAKKPLLERMARNG